MQNNEDSILIVGKKTKRKNSKEDLIKENDSSLFGKYLSNNFCLIFLILIIILILFLIPNIKSLLISFVNSIKSSNESLNNINNQTLINELNEIIKTLETNPISVSNIDKSNLNKNPTISVVIPVYYNEEKIKLTLRSIQNQNITDMEIIIIDDNSKDNSVNMIEQIQKEDPRIKLLKNQNNKGILYTRSIGVLNSKGKYIITINSGDIFLNDIFKICLEQAELNEIDMIEFSSYNYSKFNESISSIPIPKFLKFGFKEEIITQPELSSIMYKENKGSYLKYLIVDEYVWGKFIKSDIYKKTIDTLNLIIYSEKIFFFESQIINYGLFKIANSFKYINKKGIIHIHKKKIVIDEKQFYHDNIKYVISLFKNTQNINEIDIVIFEFENFFDSYPKELIKEQKKILFELFNEIMACKFINEEKKKELEKKLTNYLK